MPCFVYLVRMGASCPLEVHRYGDFLRVANIFAARGLLMIRMGIASVLFLLVSASCSETTPSPAINSSTPTAIARSVPTSTPVVRNNAIGTVTAIQSQIAEPRPTSTPRPKLIPAATAKPRVRRVPTPTPQPSILQRLAMFGLPSNCEELAPEIVDLSKEDSQLYILKIYDVKTVKPEKSTHVIECIADVRWNNPNLANFWNVDDSIRFHMEIDRSGEAFIYFEPDEILTTEELIEEANRQLEEDMKRIEEEMKAAMDAEMKRILQGEQSNTTAKSPSTPIPTSLREVMSDYRKNEARADIRYGEPFTLTAKIAQIEGDGLMLSADSIYNHVKAHVSDKSSLAVVDTGDEVNLTCIGANGSVDNIGVIINLRNCSINK